MKHHTYEEAQDATNARIRASTVAHLKDIYREHGINKVWSSHRIPPETATPIRHYASSYLSVVGSPADMCAETV